MSYSLTYHSQEVPGGTDRALPTSTSHLSALSYAEAESGLLRSTVSLWRGDALVAVYDEGKARDLDASPVLSALTRGLWEQEVGR
jgi:hypothetical protein